MYDSHGYPSIISPKNLKLFKSKTSLSESEMICLRHSIFTSYYRLYLMPIFIREKYYKEYIPILHRISTGFLADYEIYDLFHDNKYSTFENVEKANTDTNLMILVAEDMYKDILAEKKNEDENEDETKNSLKDLKKKKKQRRNLKQNHLMMNLQKMLIWKRLRMPQKVCYKSHVRKKF